MLCSPRLAVRQEMQAVPQLVPADVVVCCPPQAQQTAQTQTKPSAAKMPLRMQALCWMAGPLRQELFATALCVWPWAPSCWPLRVTQRRLRMQQQQHRRGWASKTWAAGSRCHWRRRSAMCWRCVFWRWTLCPWAWPWPWPWCLWSLSRTWRWWRAPCQQECLSHAPSWVWSFCHWRWPVPKTVWWQQQAGRPGRMRSRLQTSQARTLALTRMRRSGRLQHRHWTLLRLHRMLQPRRLSCVWWVLAG
ncbi:hypothetical protein BC831DRAFT_442076 [Entophlyctis helioformis]|nr:hypothetical protein BC831DRAFT_442076 [Entophlyctis helioformis]